MTSKIERSSWTASLGKARSIALRIAVSLPCACATFAWPRYAEAVEPVEVFDVVLLQPGDIVERRVPGGADAVSAYVRVISDATAVAVKAHPSQIPSGGFIVIASRPGGQMHAWFDFRPDLAIETTEAIDRSLHAAPALPVASGEVVFALRMSVWGAREPAAHAPAPKAWRDAAAEAGRKLDVEALVDRLWPK